MGQYEDVIKAAIYGSLNIIEQDREKEIISRRFGLNGDRETLEQIGDFLSITRERVRQLEKAIIVRLRIAAEDGKIPELAAAEKILIRNLTEEGRIAKISVLTNKIYRHEATSLEKSYLIFLGEISANLTLIEETEKYLKEKIPIIYKGLRKNNSNQEIEFELWSTGGFSEEALKLLEEYKEKTKKYKISYFNKNEIEEKAKKSNCEILKKSIKSIFSK